jgi:hypothetical protein
MDRACIRQARAAEHIVFGMTEVPDSVERVEMLLSSGAAGQRHSADESQKRARKYDGMHC